HLGDEIVDPPVHCEGHLAPANLQRGELRLCRVVPGDQVVELDVVHPIPLPNEVATLGEVVAELMDRGDELDLAALRGQEAVELALEVGNARRPQALCITTETTVERALRVDEEETMLADTSPAL